ncbi:glycosyltransferase family 4 protein [Candidatus Latescibacterota bacterium]
MKTDINPKKPIQRVCSGYNVELFRRITAIAGFEIRLFIGEDIPNSKVCGAAKPGGIDVVKLPTCFVRLGRRVLPWHRGLIRSLGEFKPDVILCEGESNFLGYAQAIWYRRRHKNTRLIHWSLGGLPGVPVRPGNLASRFKYFAQKHFDTFLAYSSFGKDCLVELGHAAEKIVVATNVADTDVHLNNADRIKDSPSEARAKLNVPDRFTILYVGSMDANKRLELFLDLAQATNPAHFNFVLLGDGTMLEELRSRAKTEGLSNVFLPGRVSDELPLYYRASDVLALPGRGGMVISEAMAWALPVVVHQADGTEYDLILDGKTGMRLAGNEVADFKNAIEVLRSDKARCCAMGLAGRERLISEYSIEQMVERIAVAVRKCHSDRQGLPVSGHIS